MQGVLLGGRGSQRREDGRAVSAPEDAGTGAEAGTGGSRKAEKGKGTLRTGGGMFKRTLRIRFLKGDTRADI